jgi:uncharacterized protein (DUF2147 family)
MPGRQTRSSVETKERAIPLLAIVLFLTGGANPPDGLIGNWVTPNNSIIRIEHCGNFLCATVGKVSSAFPHKDDVNNPDPKLRQHPLCGLRIGNHFQSVDSTHAKNGTLYDPESGKTYSGTMVANGDSLSLRGYIGLSLFGRTEVWHRISQSVGPCKR